MSDRVWVFTYNIEGVRGTYLAKAEREIDALFLFAENVVGLGFKSDDFHTEEDLIGILENECAVSFNYRIKKESANTSKRLT